MSLSAAWMSCGENEVCTCSQDHCSFFLPMLRMTATNPFHPMVTAVLCSLNSESSASSSLTFLRGLGSSALSLEERAKQDPAGTAPLLVRELHALEIRNRDLSHEMQQLKDMLVSQQTIARFCLGFLCLCMLFAGIRSWVPFCPVHFISCLRVIVWWFACLFIALCLFRRPERREEQTVRGPFMQRAPPTLGAAVSSGEYRESRDGQDNT